MSSLSFCILFMVHLLNPPKDRFPGFPASQAAALPKQACEGRGGQLARAWTQRDNTFLKDLVLSVGQMSTKFDFQDDFLGPKETYGTQVRCRIAGPSSVFF